MTATPGTPDDWTDTNPESTAPERILPTPEDVTPSATKVAMVCYAVGAASKCWEHPERAGVFDSDRASQIVTELCVALGMEQQGDTAPESARAATLTPAPEPVDPDAAAVEAIVTAYRRSPECSTHAVFGEAMLDHLRDQGFDVTPRAEQ
jgi:hypothetical protein